MNEYSKDPHRYDDMINLPHFVSKNRKHMSLSDRAAQFAPFAALTGYEESISETARLTDKEIELGEAEREELDQKLRIIAEHIKERPYITIRYFIADNYKEGGAYDLFSFNARLIDLTRRVIVAEDRRQFDIDSIIEVYSDIIDEILKKTDNY